MKYISSLFLLLFICQLPLFSQYSKGRFLVEEDLNYWFTSSPNQKNGQFKAASHIGYVPYKNWVVGIGLDVLHEREQLRYTYLDYISETKSKGIIPVLFVKRTIPLLYKLNMAIKFQSSFGWTTNEYSSNLYSVLYSGYGSGYNYANYQDDHVSHTKSISFLLSPELQFCISSRIGLLININGLGYMNSRESFEDTYIQGNHSSDFSLSLKPSNWRLGIFFLIGK